jgi:hypothetical protein
MIELVVAMTLMAVFMTLFTAAIVTMYRSANKAETLNQTSSQLNVTFDKLDASVRYASAISEPGQGTMGAWYVELRTTNTGSAVCTQLKMDPVTHQVQRRTWASPLAAGATPPAWSTLSGSITNRTDKGDLASQPFTLVPASPTVPYQQLKVHLESSVGNGSSSTASVSDTRFTALNTSAETLSTGVCTDVARS